MYLTVKLAVNVEQTSVTVSVYSWNPSPAGPSEACSAQGKNGVEAVLHRSPIPGTPGYISDTEAIEICLCPWVASNTTRTIP